MGLSRLYLGTKNSFIRQFVDLASSVNLTQPNPRLDYGRADTDSDDACEIIGETDPAGRVVSIDPEEAAKRRNALNALKDAIRREMATGVDMVKRARNPTERKKIITSMLSVGEIERPLRVLAVGISRTEQRKLVETLVMTVKGELASEEERAQQTLSLMTDIFGEWKTDEDHSAYKSDDDAPAETEVGMRILQFSAVVCALNLAVQPENLLMPEGTVTSGEEVVLNRNVTLPVAACSPDDRCLLCSTIQDSGTETCPFQRRSTFHWVRAYAVVLAMWTRNVFTEMPANENKRQYLRRIDGRMTDGEFVKLRICPALVETLLDLYLSQGSLTVVGVKNCLSAAMMALNSKALDSADAATSSATLHGLTERLIGLAEEDAEDLEAPPESSPESASAPTSNDAMSCTQRARIYVQCEGHKCFNQPFKRRCARTLVQFTPPPTRGLGLFAAEHIQRGAYVGEYTGAHVTEVPDKPVFVVLLKDGAMLDASRHSTCKVKHANHCCSQPTCELQQWEVEGKPRLGLFTKRNLEPGDELTWTYAAKQRDMLPFQCLCACCHKK